MTLGPPDPGMADRAALAAFVAAGHDPEACAEFGRVVVETSWVEDGRDGRDKIGKLHVGPICTRCGHRHCEACDKVEGIPPCDGEAGLARRLRQVAEVLGRAWQRADLAAIAAERRARGEDEWTADEVEAQAAAFERIWRDT